MVGGMIVHYSSPIYQLQTFLCLCYERWYDTPALFLLSIFPLTIFEFYIIIFNSPRMATVSINILKPPFQTFLNLHSKQPYFSTPFHLLPTSVGRTIDFYIIKAEAFIFYSVTII